MGCPPKEKPAARLRNVGHHESRRHHVGTFRSHTRAKSFSAGIGASEQVDDSPACNPS